MKLTAKPLAALIFVILFGGISLTTALGWWQTKTTKEPVKFAEGEAAGQYDPADIRGSYLFGDISRLFEIPLEDLQTAFRLPADDDPKTYAVKSLEEQYAGQPVEIGTTSVRLFVAFYRGLPFELAEDIYLPEEAIAILKQKASLTPERLSYLEAHTLAAVAPEGPEPVSQPATEPTTGKGTPVAEEHTQPEGTITGKTTFQDLLDWGVREEDIERAIGEVMPAPDTVIRDYYNKKGEEFSAGKITLQALVDAVK